MVAMLRVRKLADRSASEPVDGRWPLAGIAMVEAPEACNVPTGWVNRAVAEGWVTLGGTQVVQRPAGPAADPAARVHQFIHADTLTVHTVDGDVRYLVTHQPDKYVADGDDDTPMTREHYVAGNSRVDWFYSLVLDDEPGSEG